MCEIFVNVCCSLQQEPSEDDPLNKKRSNHVQRKLASRKANAKVDLHVEEQFLTGRVFGRSSAPMSVTCL